MQPRFLLVLGNEVHRRLTPAWPGAGRDDRSRGVDGPWVAWRLLGSNHRELARSAGVFMSAAATREAIERLRRELDDVAAVTLAGNGRWDWQLDLVGDAVAVASRLYQRPRECSYNLAVALAAMRVAGVPDTSPPTMAGVTVVCASHRP